MPKFSEFKFYPSTSLSTEYCICQRNGSSLCNIAPVYDEEEVTQIVEVPGIIDVDVTVDVDIDISIFGEIEVIFFIHI